MGEYLPVVAIAVLAAGFGLVSLVMSRMVAPRRPTAAKAGPYECGIVPTRQPPERFPVRFYLIAMIFIVFDIEIIFLYPYVVNAEALGGFGLAEIVTFSIPVFGSLIFLLANGALDWGPMKRVNAGPEIGPGRTTASTVRRVGLEGREREPVHEAEEAA